MNGFYLYKMYVSRGENARRDTPDWCYSQLLTEAFYLVGVTELFDKLEQAEITGQRINLVYPANGPQLPCGIELVAASQPFESLVNIKFVDEATTSAQAYNLPAT